MVVDSVNAVSGSADRVDLISPLHHGEPRGAGLVMDYGPTNCIVCGQEFIKRSHNAMICGEVCRQEYDTRRQRVRYAREKGIPIDGVVNLKVSPMIIRVCQHCGIEFVGYQPHYPYKYCSLECSAEARRISRASHKKKTPTNGVKIICNKCDREFVSESRFIRTCGDCKKNMALHPSYSTEWGAAI